MSIPSLTANMPLVGREREYTALQHSLDAALAGHGGLVLVSGEAGVGKTSVVEVLCHEAAAAGALVLVGRCYDLSDTAPYAPWLDAFGRYRAGDVLPPIPAAFARRGTIGLVGSEADLFAEVRDFLATIAMQRPLLFLLEDMHWADSASLDLLRSVARDLGDQRLLVLVTYRSEEVSSPHPLYATLPLLVREAHAERLDLYPLDGEAIRTLVANRYRLPESDAARLVAHLSARAEGNALFISELLRSLEGLGALQQADGQWLLGDLGAVTVPPLLRQVIDARLARLDAETRRLIAVAAVIGHVVLLDLWATVSEVEQEALLAVVAEAERAHVLAENREGTRATFSHALIREALYEGIRPSQRRRWHRATAEALAAVPDADPDTVATHFQRAADERAGIWLMRAGERAQRAWAWLAAADRFEAALALMGGDAARAGERGWLTFRLAMLRRYGDPARSLAHLEAAGRLAREADDPFLAAQVQFYQGNVRCLAGDPGRGVSEMAEGIAALTALAPVEPMSRPGIPLVDVTTARVVHYTWLGNIGRFAEARALGEQVAAETAAQESEGVASIRYGTSGGGLSPVFAYLGEPESSQRAFMGSVAANRAYDSHLLVGVNLMFTLQYAVLPYRADAIAERRRLADEAEAAWARGGGARGAIPARFTRTAVLFIEGEWAEARALALSGYSASGTYALARLFAFTTLGPLAQAQGDTALAQMLIDDWLREGPATTPGQTFYAVTVLQRVAATMAIERGDRAMARAWMEAQDHWLTWSGAVLGQSERHLGWASYHRAVGDAAAALAEAEHALERAIYPRQPLAMLAAHRLLGELDAESGRYASAARHLDAALTLADACHAPYERALTLLAQAELCAIAGERDAATHSVDEILPLFASLGARPARARAEALVARHAVAQPARPIYPAGLSAREVEVLRLVATGLSNRDIAARLFLSPRTVQVHIAHIFAKTGAENRAAATAFALRHHLA